MCICRWSLRKNVKFGKNVKIGNLLLNLVSWFYPSLGTDLMLQMLCTIIFLLNNFMFSTSYTFYMKRPEFPNLLFLFLSAALVDTLYNYIYPFIYLYILDNKNNNSWQTLEIIDVSFEMISWWNMKWMRSVFFHNEKICRVCQGHSPKKRKILICPRNPRRITTISLNRNSWQVFQTKRFHNVL